MHLSGYLAAVLIGLSLGLIGGGGSILTVPVLVYLFGVDVALATAYSLFIVGVTSLIGTVSYYKKELVNNRVVVFFGLPSVITVFLIRQFLVPVIPAQICNIGQVSITRSMLLMLLFAALMLLASMRMIKKDKAHLAATHTNGSMQYALLFIQGTVTGFITGLVGAGGGFLIIPALIHFMKMPMKNAVGTSLVIIAINSLAGFVFSLHHQAIDWRLLLSVTSIAIVGILTGIYLSGRVDNAKLKPAFGWFVLVMSIYIITRETIIR